MPKKRILITIAEPEASVLPVDLSLDQIENLLYSLAQGTASDLRWVVMPRPDDGGDVWLNVSYIIRIDFPPRDAV